MTENIQEQIVSAAINETVRAAVYLGIATVGVVFKVWLDVRSLRKGQQASFTKIRNIEKKLFGFITADADTPKGRENESR